MKTNLRTLIVVVLLACTSFVVAQQVRTLYFLENAPMRHIINPAFQPKSRFYLTLPVIGYSDFWMGSNGWTMADFVFKGPNGNTITPLHPDASGWEVGKPKLFAMDMDMRLNILGLGFAIKDYGYFHLNISERMCLGANVSSSIFQLNRLSTTTPTTLSFGVNALAYTDVSLGYSHVINDKWTVGGKLKVQLGQANVKASINDFTFTSTVDELHISAKGEVYAAAPLNWETLPSDIQEFSSVDPSVLLPDLSSMNKDLILDLVRPAGIGAAVDLGMTYKPIKNIQLTASVTDLGMIRWSRHAAASVGFEGSFNGVDVNVGELQDGSSNVGAIIADSLSALFDNISLSEIYTDPRSAYLGMLTANLNVGVDVNFWKNRIGLGAYSRTVFYDNRVAEELTFGASLRLANCFQLAASYSLFNGRASNIGAALSFAPYDGIMFTFATDYVPLTYAKLATSYVELPLPYKTPGFNCNFGIAIVAGTNARKTKDASITKINRKDLDGDGVLNKFDQCPNTPLNVSVDEHGCPLDTDGDS